MTRKDFELIAEMLVENKTLFTVKRYGQYCCSWADTLESTNPRFNRYTFLKACGVL
jgi:hypothetical protein